MWHYYSYSCKNFKSQVMHFVWANETSSLSSALPRRTKDLHLIEFWPGTLQSLRDVCKSFNFYDNWTILLQKLRNGNILQACILIFLASSLSSAVRISNYYEFNIFNKSSQSFFSFFLSQTSIRCFSLKKDFFFGNLGNLIFWNSSQMLWLWFLHSLSKLSLKVSR